MLITAYIVIPLGSLPIRCLSGSSCFCLICDIIGHTHAWSHHGNSMARSADDAVSIKSTGDADGDAYKQLIKVGT